MNLIINSSPKNAHSVGMTLAERLAKHLGGSSNVIRIYEDQSGYFNFQFNEHWIGDVIAAKALIIPVAMWNFGVPAALKDFLDKISKRGKLWDLDQNNQMIGLLINRPVFVIMTSGYEYGVGHPQDFVLPYLKAVWASFGVSDIHEFRFGNVENSRALCQDEAFLKEKTDEMIKSFHL